MRQNGIAEFARKMRESQRPRLVKGKPFKKGFSQEFLGIWEGQVYRMKLVEDSRGKMYACLPNGQLIGLDKIKEVPVNQKHIIERRV